MGYKLEFLFEEVFGDIARDGKVNVCAKLVITFMWLYPLSSYPTQPKITPCTLSHILASLTSFCCT